MKTSQFKIEGVHIIRLETGEEIIRTLQEHVQNSNIKGASISGLGSVNQVKLALYDGKQYNTFSVKGKLELSTAVGNVAWLNETPVIHLHVVVSDIEGRCWAGHLVKGNVSFTAEFVLYEFSEDLKRERDANTGLNLLTV